MSDLDPQFAADEAEVDKHILSHVKTALVLYLAVTKCKKTLEMSAAWSKSDSYMAKPAQWLLVFNAIACVLVTAYKFTSKHVAPLFLLQCISHYGFLLSFQVLLKYSNIPEIRKKSEALVHKLNNLNFVYAILIVFGFLGLSKCSDKQPYPWAFVLGDVVFFLTYVLCAQFDMKQVDACRPETGAEEMKEF